MLINVLRNLTVLIHALCQKFGVNELQDIGLDRPAVVVNLKLLLRQYNTLASVICTTFAWYTFELF